MSNIHEDAQQRISILYDELYDDGVSAIDELDEVAIEEARRKLAAEFEGYNSMVTSPECQLAETGISRVLGQVAFLNECISTSASNDDILNYRESQKWVRSDVIEAMVSSIRLCSSMVTKDKSIQPVRLELIENEQTDLYDFLKVKIKNKEIPQAYGGQLLLLFGKVQIPNGTQPKVVATAMQQVAVRLRDDTRRHESKSKEQSSFSAVALHGVKYIKKLVGNKFSEIRTIDELAVEEASTFDIQTELSIVSKQDIETAIAYALNELYPSAIT